MFKHVVFCWDGFGFEPAPTSPRKPAKRLWGESEEKARPAHTESPEAFCIASGLFLSWPG